MEKTKANKRNNRNRKNDEEEIQNTEKKEIIDETSDKFILKKYLDRNVDDLNQTELRKLKIYIDEIRALIKNKDKQNFEGLVKLAETNVI